MSDESKAKRDAIRMALLKIVAHCPSTAQCLHGSRPIVAENCRIVLDAANEALRLMTGRPSNVSEAEAPEAGEEGGEPVDDRR